MAILHQSFSALKSSIQPKRKTESNKYKPTDNQLIYIYKETIRECKRQLYNLTGNPSYLLTNRNYCSLKAADRNNCNDCPLAGKCNI